LFLVYQKVVESVVEGYWVDLVPVCIPTFQMEMRKGA